MLSNLAARASALRGFAAPLCGKAPPFRPIQYLSFCCVPAGRLSLPASLEEVSLHAGVRKGGAFPQSRRRSRK